MSSVSRLLLISSFCCAQSLLACGGSSDGRENPANGENAGASNDGDSAGAGPHGAGAPAAGRGSTGSGGAGETPASSGTKLSEIKTDAQALAVCNRIRDSISDAELKSMIRGSCAIQGQTGAAAQLGTCEALQADCTAHTPVPSTNDGCTAEDIPDCDNVTVDEYVACTRGTMAVSMAYLAEISCETDLSSLGAPDTVSACVGPFSRCPEYAAFYQ